MNKYFKVVIILVFFISLVACGKKEEKYSLTKKVRFMK